MRRWPVTAHAISFFRSIVNVTLRLKTPVREVCVARPSLRCVCVLVCVCACVRVIIKGGVACFCPEGAKRLTWLWRALSPEIATISVIDTDPLTLCIKGTECVRTHVQSVLPRKLEDSAC